MRHAPDAQPGIVKDATGQKVRRLDGPHGARVSRVRGNGEQHREALRGAACDGDARVVNGPASGARRRRRGAVEGAEEAGQLPAQRRVALVRRVLERGDVVLGAAERARGRAEEQLGREELRRGPAWIFWLARCFEWIYRAVLVAEDGGKTYLVED